MNELIQKSMRQVLDLAASAAPAPGGGSVSALTACLGLSMTIMVGNLTLGKKNYQTVQGEVTELISAAKGLSNELEILAQDDMDVFTRFMTAMGLPKTTTEEQAIRKDAMEEALLFATETPLETARVCLKGLEFTSRMAVIGNKSAVSDVGVAALLLKAALIGALLNVEANIAMSKDQVHVQRVKVECKSLIARATAMEEDTLITVRGKI